MQGFNKFDSCGSVGPHLWEYAAGTLQAAASEIGRIEAHLVRCPKCRAEVEGFRTAASAMALYISAPQTGIPPRVPNWEEVQMRLDETGREKPNPVAGISWLRAMRTVPAFAGATLGLGLCTALCAISIPWALGQKDRAAQTQDNVGSKTHFVATASLPIASKAPVEIEVWRMFNSDTGYAVPAGSFQIWPLVAYLTNNTGKAVTAQISIVDAGALSARRYERRVRLGADSRPKKVFLYPSVSGTDSSSLRQELQVTLRGPFPTQVTSCPYRISDSGRSTMGLISDARTGSLLPKRQVMADHRRSIGQKESSDYFSPSGYTTNGPTTKGYYLHYTSATATPETAPDRCIGYGSISTLVLARGAERLNIKQRAALRQWVIGGGSVILLPGAGLDLLGIAPDAPFTRAKPVTRLLLDRNTPLRRYTLGMGAALTVPVDLTQNRFRDEWELPNLWDDLRERATPLRSAAGLNEIGMYAIFDQALGYNDPFQIALPPLATVVYLFAGYFLLAVPVTFIVLKRTRRMNWAWATGPLLAAVFGGAVYGFTADLHRAKLSRRTGGILISAAGEKQALFSGTSELFFPSAGSYDVTVPNAETMSLNSAPMYQSSGNDGSGNTTPRSEEGRIISRSLEVVDSGTSVSVPGLTVPNLAFRRLSHTQPVAWGEGITTDLVQKSDGTVTGTIRNGTGRTLENAYILLQTSPRITKTTTKNCTVVWIERLAPGVNKINHKTIDISWGPELNRIMRQRNTYLFYRSGASPVLLATTSGQDLGPTVGQYVGGADTVTVAVTLPPIQKAGNPAAQGGVK